MLVSEVLERVQSEFLFGGGENLPAWAPLAADVNSSDLQITLTDRATPGGDDIFEFDDSSMELARGNYRSGTTVVLHERGYLETEAASHTAGTRVIFNNPYPKHLLLQSLQGLIGQLYGFGLYQRKTDTSLTLQSTSPTTLAADAKDLLNYVWVQEGTRWYKLRKGTDYEVMYDFDPIKVQFFSGAYGTLQVTYKAEYEIPTALTDDLDDSGIPTSLQYDLALGVAAKVLVGKDVPEATADHIQRQLDNQAIPVGTRISVSTALWQMFRDSISLERSRLVREAPPGIVYSG